MSGKTLKIIGMLATVLGLGLNLANNWIDDKKMEESVDKKVNEALAKREES